MSRAIRLATLAVLVALLSLSAASTSLVAQQAPAQPAVPALPGGPAPAAPGPQQPTFAMEVNLVTTDVIARDDKNLFISDLKREDFEVFEDGVKQELASLTLVHGGRTFNLQSAPPPPAQEGIILPPPRPTNDAAGRIFLLFVDDLHMDFRNTGRIRELFKKIANNLIHEGDMFGIVTTGTSSIAIDLTYDRKRLEEARNRITGGALTPDEIIQGAESSQGPTEVRYRAHVAFSTAYDLIRNLEKIQNRRKAVIYVSNGYDFNPFAEGRLGEDPFFGGRFGQDVNESRQDPFSRQGQQFADTDLMHELAELTRAANRANATLYTIDPRGLIGGSEIDQQVNPTDWSSYVQKTQNSLRTLAEQTGGIAVVNQNDFDKALKRIDAETSDYYVLGYYSSNPDPTVRTRKLEVKVKRPDVQVWSRRTYSLRPTSSPSAQQE